MLSIFIVNYNTYNETNNCINSIINSNLSNLKYEIIILENNSKKNIYKYKNNNIKVFYLGKNYGFAKAANYGISKSRLMEKPSIDFTWSSCGISWFTYSTSNICWIFSI